MTATFDVKAPATRLRAIFASIRVLIQHFGCRCLVFDDNGDGDDDDAEEEEEEEDDGE